MIHNIVLLIGIKKEYSQMMINFSYYGDIWNVNFGSLIILRNCFCIICPGSDDIIEDMKTGYLFATSEQILRKK